jgi:hypothetical protein
MAHQRAKLAPLYGKTGRGQNDVILKERLTTAQFHHCARNQ